jgi:hypothetical protein
VATLYGALGTAEQSLARPIQATIRDRRHPWRVMREESLAAVLYVAS